MLLPTIRVTVSNFVESILVVSSRRWAAWSRRRKVFWGCLYCSRSTSGRQPSREQSICPLEKSTHHTRCHFRSEGVATPGEADQRREFGEGLTAL
jgi:hypothetical protein